MLRLLRAIRHENPKQRTRHARATRGLGRRLAVEPLEQRQLLAAVCWDGGGDGSSWGDANNWDGNTLPSSADDVCIDDRFTADAPQVSLFSPTQIASLKVEDASLDLISAALDVTGGVIIEAGGRIRVGCSSAISKLETGTTLINRGTLEMDDNAVSYYSLISGPVQNDGVFTARGMDNLILGTLTNAGTVSVLGLHGSNYAYRQAALTVYYGVFNQGTIGLTSSNTNPEAAAATLTVLSGGLENAPGASIDVAEGPDGAGVESYLIDATLDNQGQISIATDIDTYVEFRGSLANSGILAVTSGEAQLYTAVGDNAVNGGTIEIASGATVVNYNYTQTDLGTLDTEVTGTGASDLGRLSVTGPAALDGTLNLTFSGGFTPSDGDTFQPIQYASHSSQFAAITATNVPPSIAFTADYGTYEVTITAESTGLTITDLSATPTAISEGEALSLSGAFLSADPSASSTVVIAWGDGSENTTLSLAAGELNFSAPHTYQDDPAGTPDQYTIGVTVSQGASGSDTASTTVVVNNVAPTVEALTGPQAGVPGQTLSFAADFTDPGTLDAHTTEWQVTDGFGGTVATGTGTAFSFSPTAEDMYTVSFTVTDDDGGSGSESMNVVVGPTLVAEDPLDPTKMALFAVSNPGGGRIDVRSGSQPGTVQVRIDGTDVGEFASIDRIIVFGQDGDDDLKVHADLGVPAELYGGAGNDKLRGGQGNDVLVGGPGDDLLSGHDGRDLLIGGAGRDKVHGHEQDDILIGGIYAEENNREAILAVMAEWTRTDLEYADRVAHLRDGGGLNGAYLLNESTVSDDNVKDILKGNEGLDWFLANADDDKTDLELEEILSDVEYEFVTLL